MEYFYSCHTDIGTVREVNEDSLVIKSMNLGGEKVFLGAVCDGVGGLDKGELASRRTADMVSEWFDYEIPQILGRGRDLEVLSNRFKKVITDINGEIYRQGQKDSGLRGTTLTMFLLWNYQFVTGHVGDSRAYEIRDKVRLLTHDHTWVAREMELGHMTAEEARQDKRQNVILRCIGAEHSIQPEITTGLVHKKTTFILCSDGFWHNILPEEMVWYFSPMAANGEAALQQSLYQSVELVKKRGEKDNITAIAITVY